LARYFFDFHDVQLTTRDEEGTECADREAVTAEALLALCQIAEDHPDRYVDGKLRVIVRDASDRTVLTASINLSAAWHVDEEQQAA
jgi:hypothetical protein